MSPLPERPFFTKDFAPGGGGIDFLGLRFVNLHMVGDYLIPELNNVTQDMGTFLLGAWIPWKFRQLCCQNDFTPTNYRSFREKVEVAISQSMRDDSAATQQFGIPRNRIGRSQKLALPGPLTFKGAQRSRQNSLYAAAIYGPAIRALGLIKSYRALTEDGSAVNIALAGDDVDTGQLIQMVDGALKGAPAYRKLASLDSPSFTVAELDRLGVCGLSPAFYRESGTGALKQRFQDKVLPTDPASRGYARTQTARLLLATLRQRKNLPTQEIRDAWYTGMFGDGTSLRRGEEDLQVHRGRWSYFMARQYQRYAIEVFLSCFETALVEGCRTIGEAVQHWEKRSVGGGRRLCRTFRGAMEEAAGNLLGKDDARTSAAWNAEVHAEDDRFEFVEEPMGEEACFSGLRMLSGWYWRMLQREGDARFRHLMTLGGSDRMSMSWLMEWLRSRQNIPMRDFLKEVFSDLIFSQHMRVALARFDGKAQRLRFALGDSGIEPMRGVKIGLGKLYLPWMPDRLDTLVFLLCDIDVLRMDEEGKLSLGPRAGEVQ